MNACPDRREALALLAMDNLDDVARVALQSHLDTCDGCRAEWETVRRTCGQLRQLSRLQPSAELSGDFHQRLHARLRREADADRPVGITDWIRRWFSMPRVSLAAGVALVLIGILVWVERKGPEKGSGSGIVLTPTKVGPRGNEWHALPDDKSAPTLMVMSRALRDSFDSLDAYLAHGETILAANDPPSRAFDR